MDPTEAIFSVQSQQFCQSDASTDLSPGVHRGHAYRMFELNFGNRDDSILAREEAIIILICDECIFDYFMYVSVSIGRFCSV